MIPDTSNIYYVLVENHFILSGRPNPLEIDLPPLKKSTTSTFWDMRKICQDHSKQMWD